MFNEILQMILYYHLILFSKKTWNSDARYEYGKTFLGTLCLIMVVNLMVTALDTIGSARRRKLDSLKATQLVKIA